MASGVDQQRLSLLLAVLEPLPQGLPGDELLLASLELLPQAVELVALGIASGLCAVLLSDGEKRFSETITPKAPRPINLNVKDVGTLVTETITWSLQDPLDAATAKWASPSNPVTPAAISSDVFSVM